MLRGHPEEVAARCSHVLHAISAEHPGVAATAINSSILADIRRQHALLAKEVGHLPSMSCPCPVLVTRQCVLTSLGSQGDEVVALAVKVLPKSLHECVAADPGYWDSLCSSVNGIEKEGRGEPTRGLCFAGED